MSKETALAMLTGNPAAAAQAKPGLLTPDVKTATPPTEDKTPAEMQEALVPAAVEPAKDELNASRLAIFAKREAAFLKQQEDFKREREAFTKEREQSDQYLKRGREFDELYAKDKEAALRMIGLTDTDFVNLMAGKEEKTETSEEATRRIAQEESQKIREELAADKKKHEEERSAHLITQLKTDIKSTAKTNAEKYEYTLAEGAEGELLAYAFIEENLKTNNEMLTPEQALDMAEEYFEERDKTFDAIRKRKSRLKIVDPEAQTTGTESPAGAQAARGAAAGTPPASNAKPARTSTLTNEVTATASGVSKFERRETEDQKKQRIIEKIRNGEYRK